MVSSQEYEEKNGNAGRGIGVLPNDGRDWRQGQGGEGAGQDEPGKQGESPGCGIEGSPEEREKKGFVYFIETEDRRFIKIGYSIDPSSRIAEHRAFASDRFGVEIQMVGLIPGTLATEQWLHVQFRRHRVKNEWYDAAPIREAFSRLALLAPPQARPHPLTVKELAAMGGKARAKGLCPKRQKEIAVAAAQARWGGKKSDD